MPTNPRLRGNSGLFLTFDLDPDGASSPVSVADDVKQWELTNEDKDDSDLTFYEAAQGLGKDYSLALTAISSTLAGSLWRFLWDNPGAEIGVVVGPHGNATPTAEKPHFTFRAKVGGKPQLSNEARVTNVGADFEHTLAGTTDVTLDEGAAA